MKVYDNAVQNRIYNNPFSSLLIVNGRLNNTTQKEQTLGLYLINVGIEQVDRVHHTNTSSAEECASAPAELSVQARR